MACPIALIVVVNTFEELRMKVVEDGEVVVVIEETPREMCSERWRRSV